MNQDADNAPQPTVPATRSPPSSRSARRVLIALILLSCVPPLSIVYKIVKHGVNAPFFDEWFPGGSVDVALRVATGNFQPTDLLVQNFDHRLVFSRLTTSILAWLGHWNLKYEMALSVVLAACSWMLIIGALGEDEHRTRYYLLLPFSVLIFSVRQQNNWLWGMQTSWFFALFFLTAALWVTTHRRVNYKTLACVVLLCCCGTFSFGPGILSWPLMMVAMWLVGYRRATHFALFLAGAALSLTAFFHDYHFTQGNLVLREMTVRALLNRMLFGLSFLGGGLVPDDPQFAIWAAIIGAACVAATAANLIYLRRADYSWRDLTVWVVLAGYALGSAVLLARSSRIQGHTPLAGRFVTNSTPLLLATLGTGVARILRGELKPRSPAPRPPARYLIPLNEIVLALVTMTFLFTTYQSWPSPAFLATQSSKACLVAYPRTHDGSCFGSLLPFLAEGYRRVVDLMAENRLSAFYEVPRMESALSALPIPTETDLVFDLSPSMWNATNISFAGAGGVSRVGEDPILVYRKPLHECLAKYSHLRVSIAASKDIFPRDLQVFYLLEGEQAFTEEHSLHIYLVPGGELAEYSYDLRTLSLPPNARLVGMRLDPVGGAGFQGESVVRITDFRLSRLKGSLDC